MGELAKRSNGRFKTIINDYDKSKKDELVRLGQGTKSYNDILTYLNNEITKSRQINNFNYTMVCFREDGAYQLNKAVEEIYGASINKGDETPSGGERPVELIDVQLSDGSRVKVPFGRLDTPDLGKGSYIDTGYDAVNNLLFVQGSCEFRYASIIDNIIDRTKLLLNTESIYKHQAFELDSNFTPKTLNLDSIDSQFMILSKQAEYDLQPLNSRIMHPELCIEKGIPLKYGTLFEGIYGLLVEC